MFASCTSAALHGISAFAVNVEVDVAGGLPQYVVVGLPTPSVREGAMRIRAALRHSGYDLPSGKVTVNLAPADRRKDGVAFDLPIAAAVVAADRQLSPDVLADLLILGELGLDGSVRRVRGVLPAAAHARALGMRGVLVPYECGAEAAVVPGIEVYAVSHLSEVLGALLGEAPLPRWQPAAAPAAPTPSPVMDFADVRGQIVVRRAVEVAVAGGHNVLLIGPPGIGKTMIARRMPGILPPLSREEAIELTCILSAAGHAIPGGLVTERPFRAPHHTISTAALVGGGPNPRPGEISLAHRGVLFLDEFPEFSRVSIEALRQPLEDRVVRIGRVRSSVELPASFLLVAAANPCPCGWLGSEARACVCSPRALERYRARLSGPILDRIDIQVRIENPSLLELRADQGGEPSSAMLARIIEARARQTHRLASLGIRTNAEMTGPAQRATVRLTAGAEALLRRLTGRRHVLTARGVDRLLRTARTIADLGGSDVVGDGELAEAAAYRALDRDPTSDPRRLLA